MIPYIGDFAEDATIYHYFNTFDSNDPSASVTITDLADTDIYVYKDGSVTDLVTDGATVVIDFDSRTGVHKLTIDTSVHADYAVGSDYMVLIEGTTIDAGTVTAAVFTFSIENRYNDVNVVSVSGTTQTAGDIPALVTTVDTVVDGIQTDLSNGTDGLGAIKAETALIVADTNELQTDDVPGLIATLDAVVDTVKVDTAAILVDTAEIGAAGAGLTVLATAANLATVDTVVDGIQTDLSNGTDGLGAIKADTAAILVDTGTTLDTKINDIQGATFSSATDSLEAVRDRGDAAWTTGAGGTPPQLLQSTTIATLASQTSFTLTAGSTDDDAYNGAVAVITDVSTSTQKAVGSILDYTGSTKTVTLSADPGIFTMAATDTIDIIANASTAPTAGANAIAVWDAVQSSHVTGGSFGEIATEIASILVDTAEIGAAGAGLTDLATAAALATVDSNVDAILVDTGTTLDAAIAVIDANVDQIETAVITNAAGVDVSADIAAVKADTAAILVDTGTTLDGKIDTIDTNVDAILVDTGTTLDAAIAVIDANVDQIETAVITNAAGVDISADIAAVKVDTAAVLVDTNEIQGDWTNGGRLDLIIDAILADTGTDGVILTAAERNSIADAILNRDMSTGTDSGSTTVRTVRQALRASRNKVGIAGGTLTVYKEDDSTASWTAAITTTAGDPISDMDPAGP